MALSWYSFTGGTFSYLMMNARMSGVNAAPATEQLGMRHERKLDSVEDFKIRLTWQHHWVDINVYFQLSNGITNPLSLQNKTELATLYNNNLKLS